MRRAIILLAVLCLALPAAPGTHAQDGSEWRVERAASVVDLVQDLVGLLHYYPAPNARAFAYGLRGGEDEGTDTVCTVNVALPLPFCVPVAREMAYTYNFHEFFPPLRWSPDSTRVAVVGSPYTLFRDTDLGIVDFSQMTFTNVADDAHLGDIMFDESAPDVFLVDSQPTWSPDGTRLAVERTRVTEEDGLRVTDIVVVDAATGEELLAVPHPLAGLDKGPGAGTTVGMDWSPDGSTLALSIRGISGGEPQNGLWLLGVDTGELNQVLDFAQAVDALRPFVDLATPTEVFALAPIRWSPDGARLLVWQFNPGNRLPQRTVFWVEPGSGAVNVLVLPGEPAGGEEIPTLNPVDAAWSPDGSALLVLALNADAVDPAAAIPLIPDAEPYAYSLFVVDVATGTSTLLGHLPYQPPPLAAGQWSADGSALLGGFLLELARE